jgi:type I restriction enzyme S subunit
MLGKSAAYMNFTNDVELDFIRGYLSSSSFKDYCDNAVSGTTINNIGLAAIGNTRVTLPPLNEQKEIVMEIKKRTAEIDQSINLQSQQIQKLKEYRTVLIDAAVTGKIRVG